MLDASEEALDAVASFVDRSIEGTFCDGGDPIGDDGDGVAGNDRIRFSSCIIGFVGQNEVGLKAMEQSLDLGDVIAFTAGQQDADWPACRICSDMDLRAQPTLGTTDRLSFSPLLDAPALCW